MISKTPNDVNRFGVFLFTAFKNGVQRAKSFIGL